MHERKDLLINGKWKSEKNIFNQNVINFWNIVLVKFLFPNSKTYFEAVLGQPSHLHVYVFTFYMRTWTFRNLFKLYFKL